ncbi:TPA: leucine-rich repeat domain-containing protein [Pseudomonas putida]|nr:leucine-rich repeat domain-containing protein [Pseudomonas putida]
MTELFVNSEGAELKDSFIKGSIPAWLTNAAAERRQALKNVPRTVPDWYRTASADSHRALQQAVKCSWISQNNVDRLFKDLADVRQFAEPLLSKALKEQLGIELDVNKTYLRIYIPKGLVVGYEVKTISVLDAALLNFEKKETVEHYFDRASCFITEPSASGQFHVLSVTRRLSIAAFASLCRRLDIGGQYQQRLETLLLQKDAVAKAVLAHEVIISQQDRFRVAVLLAHMKGDINDDAQSLLLGLLAGGTIPRLAGRVQHCHQLSMLGTTLTGIVLFAADLERSQDVVPVIVYVPDDPEHPLKTYASTGEFAAELVRQLRASSYRRFFTQFVAHEHRSAFLASLHEALSTVRWHPHQAGDSRPAWRTVEVPRPVLRLQAQRFQGELWTWLYQSKLNKILNDAQDIAVSTAQEDRKSRWDEWDRLQKIATSLLDVATLVAIPFVPLMGELMLAYTAYQLLDDTFTGILDWSEGQLQQASDHLLAITESIVQVAAFAVGGLAVGKLLAVKPPAFVEGLKIVDVGSGDKRLWHPDLGPYERSIHIPADTVPDELGLHEHEGTKLLPLDGKIYEVETEASTGNYRIRHPGRPDAYKPRLSHNGVGAWAHEVERPMEWQGAQLFRRLGHSVAEFSDVSAARILAVSGVDEAVLRDLHVHARRPPALLEESIRRFKSDQRIQAFIAQIQSADSTVYAKADTQIQVQFLRTQGVSVQGEQLRGGNLVRSIVDSLDDMTLKQLLGESQAFGDALPGADVCAARLRSKMSRWAEDNRVDLFEALEGSFERSSDQAIEQMRRVFPQLPKTIALELLRNATASDRLHMLNKPGIPRPMAHETLFYLREFRLGRAYEGLYLDSVFNRDTDILSLHMLETLEGWSEDVRIEVRDGDFSGALLDSIGEPDAPIRKVLIREQSQYQAYSDSGEHLHGLDSLYGAVMHALPDAQRQALGLPHAWQGTELKEVIRRKTLLPRPQLRALLGQPPIAPGTRSPMALALGRSGYLLGGGESRPLENTGTLHQRLRRLFPTVTEEELEVMRRERLGEEPLPVMARLENEYVTLLNDLELWVSEAPGHDPQTGALLSAEETSAQKRYREAFAEVVQASWSRRLTVDNRFDTGRFFSKVYLLGDLPELSADFSHIAEFILINHSPFLRGDGFLKGFSGLQFLTMRGVHLASFPVETFQMRSLVSLSLEDCNLHLTDATVEGLAHMEGLEALDLDNNPLGLTPHVGHMKSLSRLQLMSTGLTQAPEGLFSLEKLTLADLTFNQIVELPDELFDVLDTQPTNFNFSNNPLSLETRQRIAAYDENSSLDRKILIQFDDEVEVESEDEGSDTEFEDSGLESGEESDSE